MIMKQFILFCIFSIILATNSQPLDDRNVNAQQYMIPDEAIRLRILANSDTLADQQIKFAVRDQVSEYIRSLVYELDDIEEARNVIRENVPVLEAIVADTIAAYGKTYPFEVTYAKNVPFPEKMYGPYVYPEGEYEAVLITLGDGTGENWWCVLFPPLCFVDLFGETKVADASEDVDQKADVIVEADETEEEMEEDEKEVESEDVEIRFFLFDLFNLS